MAKKQPDELKVEEQADQPSQLQVDKFLKLLADIFKRAQSEQEDELEKAS